MKRLVKKRGCFLGVASILLTLISMPAAAEHDVRGITGPNFELYAFPFNMDLPDGTSLHMWGFGDKTGGAGATHAGGAGLNLPQYPAPTLIVNQGQLVTITLENFGVPQGVSIVVTGHEITASGGTPGLVTEEAVYNSTPGATQDTVTYTFTPTEPGTYMYHSMGAPSPGLHIEMGLVGALIVRPAGYDATPGSNRTAYGAGVAGTDYDQEFLFFLTEADPNVHLQMERGHYEHFSNNERKAMIWFVNGRVFPDLFQGDYNSVFPHQPYQAVAMAHPGDRVLVREVNAGQDSHPFHHHGENLTFIARDGRVLSSDGTAADLGRSDNTLNSAPRQAVDMIWTWTGKEMGWDIYGPAAGSATMAAHTCTPDADGFDTTTYEWCADHNKAFPVSLPGAQDLTFGGWWSGSPFLGDTGGLPPGEGGLNPFGGYFFVWHSHAEKELTTFDIFPGGSLSTVIVMPSGAAID